MSHSIHRFRKLLRMSPREIAFRSRAILRQQAERAGHRLRPAWAGIRGGELDPTRCTELVPGTKPSEIAELKRIDPRYHAQLESRTVQRAEYVLSGRFQLLGHQVPVHPPIRWHEDPKTGYHWPAKYFADVPIRGDASQTVDVKLVWELARHQYAVDLARAWRLTGDDRFAHASINIVMDWIAANRQMTGIHWTSALEAGIRSISWTWILAALADWHGLSSGVLRTIGGALTSHALYLERNLSFYTSPYNHLIGEATALCVLGRALAGDPRSARWRTLGARTLVTHGPQQFYGDGFSVEQSIAYHYFTLGFLVQALVAIGGEPGLDTLQCAMRRAFLAGRAFRQPDGSWPRIGDADSARSIPVGGDEGWCFDALEAVGAVLFQEPALKTSTFAGEELFWLMGTRGIDRWNRLPESPAEGETHTELNESGYAIMSDRDGNWLLVDAGPVAAGLHPDATPSTAHGHADTLQVCCWHKGRPLLVDSGIPAYHPDATARYFRDASAHNTVAAAAGPVARHAPGLAWTHARGATRLRSDMRANEWTAVGRLTVDHVRFERSVCFSPERGLYVADWIECDRPDEITWTWCLPASTLYEIVPSGDAHIHSEGGLTNFGFWSSSPLMEARLRTGSSESLEGWIGRDYGVLAEGQHLRVRTECQKSILAVTYFGDISPSFELAFHGKSIAGRLYDEPVVEDVSPGSEIAAWHFSRHDRRTSGSSSRTRIQGLVP